MSGTQPDPDRTPGLQPGGGVDPGDTPPNAASTTSGISGDQAPAKRRFVGTGPFFAVAIIAVVLVAMFVVMAVLRAQGQ